MATTRKRIGIKNVEALKPGETIWDDAVTGFCARRQKSEARTYGIVYRTAERRQRWQTIGRHGAPWSPDEARARARKILAQVADGLDPAAEKYGRRTAATVADLCDLYMADVDAGRLLTRRKAAKKPSTIATDRGRVERHIKPLIGQMKVTAVTLQDIETFMHAVAGGQTAGRSKTAAKRGLANVRGGRGTATRTVGLLGSIFTFAVRHRMRPDNPVRGVIRFEDGRRDRRMSDAEYGALGRGLRGAEAASVWPAAIAMSRFLALTGWRSGEALDLRWNDVNLFRRVAILPDSKSGRSERPLSRAACDLLRSLSADGQGSLVFPATRGAGRMTGYPKLWAKIAPFGGLPTDITPHTMRHSFASLAADLGYSELTIAVLIGHKGQTMTSRYAHVADTVTLAAADRIAEETVKRMGDWEPVARHSANDA